MDTDRLKAKTKAGLGGISLKAIGRGNRRMLAPLKARHAEAKGQHAEVLAALDERRAKAREIEDPEKRSKALEALKSEKPMSPTLVAAGCTVVAAVVAWPMLHGHHTVVAATGLTLWLLAALVLGQQDAENTATEATEEAEEAPAEASAPTGPTPAQTHALTASLTAGGESVLLTRIASRLASSHPGWTPARGAVRALLTEAGVPVREGVRTPDGNGPGVHHQDVPPLPSPAAATPGGPVVANVGPGQSANANTNNSSERITREGFVVRADPDNPARTVVLGKLDAA
ncbi:hypothetical protein [Kitasatospora sp. McL0602]|uniref:hypothetical protein n=1 Tax=Kitasatospora sp. McL0602 TaxID=3439530 RepID=UPI003F898AFF